MHVESYRLTDLLAKRTSEDKPKQFNRESLVFRPTRLRVVLLVDTVGSKGFSIPVSHRFSKLSFMRVGLFNRNLAGVSFPLKHYSGIFFRSRTVSFRGMKSNDLESAASVPGTNIVLFAESGDDNTVEAPTNPQIYKARLTRNGVRIVGVTPWPAMIFNVEATAVAQLGENYVFLYAERADGQASTDLNWASFDPNTMEFGEFSFVTFNSPDPAAYNRPLVAMDLDSSGQIYIASAFDPENAFPDSIADNGPFASAVYRIGQLVEVDGEPRVELYPPVFEGQCDGFKVESVAIRETEEEGLRIFVGVDDENYGATMRQLPPLPQAP